MAGPSHYRGIKEIYPVQYARVIYYPLEDSDEISSKYQFIGQFFPFIIRKDLYGYYIIPENIHNISKNQILVIDQLALMTLFDLRKN